MRTYESKENSLKRLPLITSISRSSELNIIVFKSCSISSFAKNWKSMSLVRRRKRQSQVCFHCKNIQYLRSIYFLYNPSKNLSSCFWKAFWSTTSPWKPFWDRKILISALTWIPWKNLNIWKSGVPIYNCEVSYIAGKKTRKRKYRQLQSLLRFQQTRKEIGSIT